MLDITYDTDASLLDRVSATAHQWMPPFQRPTFMNQQVSTGARQQRMSNIAGNQLDAFLYLVLSISIISAAGSLYIHQSASYPGVYYFAVLPGFG
jgi:hypothetical protein